MEDEKPTAHEIAGKKKASPYEITLLKVLFAVMPSQAYACIDDHIDASDVDADDRLISHKGPDPSSSLLRVRENKERRNVSQMKTQISKKAGARPSTHCLSQRLTRQSTIQRTASSSKYSIAAPCITIMTSLDFDRDLKTHSKMQAAAKT